MADLTSSTGGFRSFKQITHDRLIKEMLHTVKLSKGSTEWKVLIMDEMTVKVMSCSCKMTEITDEGISLVEDLKKSRQPLPALDAVYFIQPSGDNVRAVMGDMTGKSPRYRKAYIFLSSPMPRELLQSIRGDASVLSRVAVLREVNLEFLAIDTEGFTTDHDKALVQLFGEHSEGSIEYDICIESVAMRLSTVFASMKEFPFVRYCAAKPPAANPAATITAPDLVSTKLAAALWDRLMKYKSTLIGFPQFETCELVIVSRSIDPVAPIIHEWTYDAMCHDLLDLDGNKYLYEMTTSSGKKEKKEVLLEEHDPIWLELRDLHIADANLRLTERMQQFGVKNKAAQIRLGTKEGQEISTRDMQKMVQALPQYREQLEKLSLHIHVQFENFKKSLSQIIATVLNDKIKKYNLNDIGNLEQDFVYGEATSKELLSMINSKHVPHLDLKRQDLQDMTHDDKLRLLLMYAATHPEKLDAARRLQWMKVAKLSGEDMNGINNLEYLGVSVSKKQSGVFSLKFRAQKSQRPVRKDKNQDEATWQLSRFYPLIEDMVEALSKDELSKEEFPYVKEPSSPAQALAEGSSSVRTATAPTPKRPHSVRTIRYNWAANTRAVPAIATPSDSNQKIGGNESLISGKRIFIFIAGGITRSELRTVHKLTAQLRREVILGSTNLDNPRQFVHKLKSLSTLDDLD